MTTTYPGASGVTVVNQVALPIELQVNGVEGMIYMQSTSTDTGTYTLTVTFEIGTDLDFAQVLVQNRVSAALASLPQPVQAQGLTVQKKSTSILADRVAVSPDGALRQPLPQQLRHHQPGQRAVARAGRRQRQRAGRRQVLDAHLAGPAEALHLRPDAVGRDPGHPVAEPAGDRGPGRHAAGRPRTRASSTPSTSQGQLSTTRRSSPTSSSRPRRATAAASCG